MKQNLPRPIQPGTIDITNNWETVYEILRTSNSDIYVIDMNEGEDPNVSKNHPRVLGGSCLLPPTEAVIALVDGEKNVFRMIYAEHFASPFVDDFVGALIIFLCRGGKLLLSFDDEVGIVNDFIDIFWMRYGIKIGIVGETGCMMDPSCIPIWLQYMYRENAITGIEFLYNYPVNVQINDAMINKLIEDVQPYADTFELKVKELYKMVVLLKETPNLVNPIIGWIS